MISLQVMIYFCLGALTGRYISLAITPEEAYFSVSLNPEFDPKLTHNPTLNTDSPGNSSGSQPHRDPSHKTVMPFSSRVYEQIKNTKGWAGLELILDYPKVYVVTPTFRRPNQFAELTRVYQALYPVRQAVHWVVVDEAEKSTKQHLQRLKEFLAEFNITSIVLRSFRRHPKVQKFGNPRGVGARRRALHYLRLNGLQGVVYFADDDNTYDSEVFAQMQKTRKLSAWPVGCLTQLALGSPVVQDGVVIGFHDGWIGSRLFPFDFAGFAVNVKLLHAFPKANIPWIVSYEETQFLKSLHLLPESTEPLGDKCTRVMAYHTRTVRSPATLMNTDRELSERLENSNIPILWDALVDRSPLRVYSD